MRVHKSRKKNKHQIQLLRLTSGDNSPIQDCVHRDDQTQPTFEMTHGFKPFTENIQEFRSDGAWNVSFCALLMPAYKVTKVAGQGTTGQTRGLQTERSFFYDAGFSAKLRSCQFVTS